MVDSRVVDSRVADSRDVDTNVQQNANNLTPDTRSGCKFHIIQGVPKKVVHF